MTQKRIGLTKKEVINTVYDGGGHIVILGAGASIASTIRNPEKSGKVLPAMKNLIKVIGLSDVVKKLPKKFQKRNFETLYSLIGEDRQFADAVKEIEDRVQKYFQSLELPEVPTIYDYLVLSLRPKDIIATFNWDPFLFQAWSRHRGFADLPYLAFLHGNVAIGYNEKANVFGAVGLKAKDSNEILAPTKLLFPVSKKNYQDSFLTTQWDMLKDFLNDQNVKRITIFGYAAPKSDLEAIKILSESWFLNKKRDVEDIEIIDILPPERIERHWSKFIPSDYYSIKDDYFKSILAHNPRRTSESFFHHSFAMTEDEAWAESNPVPQNFKTLDEMRHWFRPLIEAEENKKK